MSIIPGYRTTRDNARLVTCPKCSAPPHEHCRRNDGFPRMSCHAVRHALACKVIHGEGAA